MRQETNVSKEDLDMIHNTLMLSFIEVAETKNYSLLERLNFTLTILEGITRRFNHQSKKPIVKRTKYK